MRLNRGTRPSGVSTVSTNMDKGLTHKALSPYSGRYTTSDSSVSEWRATPKTVYSRPL